jgi:hypothetical protein
LFLDYLCPIYPVQEIFMYPVKEIYEMVFNQ